MEKTKIELGKEYGFAGYRWVPVEINEDRQVAIMQSLGVTAGPWPGFSMEKFGNGDYYSKNIDGYDISEYNDKTRALMRQIRPVSSGIGLYLPSYKNIEDNQIWKDTLAKAAGNYRSRVLDSYAWTGTCVGGYAYSVDLDGDVNYNNQSLFSSVVPVAFNLDLSKIEIDGDEIKVQVSKTLGSTEYNNPAQSLINKLHKQAEETQKLLNFAAEAIETYACSSSYFQERFFNGFPVQRQGDDESDGIECPTCKYEVARNDDYTEMRPKHCPNCGTKLIY